MRWSKRLQLWKKGKLEEGQIEELERLASDFATCATSECPIKLLKGARLGPLDKELYNLALEFCDAVNFLDNPCVAISIEKQIRAKERELLRKERK